MEQESWQIQMIEDAVRIADNSESQWIDSEDVEAWLDSWGMEGEKATPCV